MKEMVLSQSSRSIQLTFEYEELIQFMRMKLIKFSKFLDHSLPVNIFRISNLQNCENKTLKEKIIDFMTQ